MLVVGDIAGLGAGEARLSLLTNKDGGIIDDTIITNAGDFTYVDGWIARCAYTCPHAHLPDPPFPPGT